MGYQDVVFLSSLYSYWARDVLMGYQDVVFLSSLHSYCTIFLKNCGRGESLMTTTCPKTGCGKQGHQAPCVPTKPLFVSVEYH